MAVVHDKEDVYGKDGRHQISNFRKQDIPVLRCKDDDNNNNNNDSDSDSDNDKDKDDDKDNDNDNNNDNDNDNDNDNNNNNNNNGIYNGIFMKWLFIHCFQTELEFRSVDFCGERKTREPGEKPSEQGVENQQQTQPTCDAGSGNPTRATAVGGECSYHYAIPAPQMQRCG